MNEQAPTGNELTVQDAQNLIALINKAPVTGAEAEIIAVLKFKIGQIIQPTPAPEAAKPKKD